MFKKHVFEDLPAVDGIELEVRYLYTFVPGRYSGPPECCYPDTEESEVVLPEDWQAEVIKKYIEAGRAAIKNIAAEARALESDGTVRRWAEAELQNNQDCEDTRRAA